MLVTTITIITASVAINFILLHFSCNKVDKSVKTDKKPIVLSPNRMLVEENESLAPTGS